MRILDESTGGFSVEADEHPGCQIGDTLLLEVALTLVEVRVVNLECRQPTPEDSEELVAPTPTRVSLMRIRDVDECEVAPYRRRLPPWVRFRMGLVPLARSCKGMARTIVGFVAAGIVIVWLLENATQVFEALRAVAR